MLKDNLFGLEIDPRCTQLAAFNLALAAWKLGGHQALPSLNLACSGLAPNAREADWLAIAGDQETAKQRDGAAVPAFQRRAHLGSLINPRVVGSDLYVADVITNSNHCWKSALAREPNDDTAHELAVAATWRG